MSFSGIPADVSRRQLLIRSAAVAALVGPGSALAAGCAAGSGNGSKPRTRGSGQRRDGTIPSRSVMSMKIGAKWPRSNAKLESNCGR